MGRGTSTGARSLDDGTATARLSVASRTWRGALVLVLAAGYLGGSVVGDDHWWPFAPWRMFSTSTAPTGTVTASALEVQTASNPQWHGTGLNPANVGLNRAEVEGQQPELRADPDMLGSLAESHARLNPGSEPWTGVRLVRRSTVIEDRQPTGETISRVVVEWTVADGGHVVDQVVTTP
jgi:hypothetical protein